MGVKDDNITPYFDNPQVFCDFMNGAVFGGKQVLRPEYAERLPREMIHQLPWEADGRSNKKTLIRDTVKQAYFHTMYVIFICENQSEIHYGMPVRMLLYDSVQYGDQMKKIQKENRKAGNLKTPAEFLSGLHKGEQLVHLIDPRNIDSSKFPGDWRLILETLKCGNHKKDLQRYVENHRKELEELSAEASRALLTMLGQDIDANEGKEGITVCRALEELKEEGKTEGKIEGKKEEEDNIIRKMLNKRLTAITICHWLDTEEGFVMRIAELQERHPDYSNAQILEEISHKS